MSARAPPPPVLAKLRPAFSADGTVTAGSACQISDGAAAVVVMSRAKAEELGAPVLAEIGAHGVVAGPDPSLLSQPSNAILKALGREGKTPADVDLFEINEAFAAVALQSMRDLDIDDEQRQRQRRRDLDGPPRRRVRAPGSRCTWPWSWAAAAAGSARPGCAAAAARARPCSCTCLIEPQPMSEPYRPVGPQGVTARVAAIVLAVAARTHPSMTEVARTVGLPVSTTHRLLSGLVAGRLVERTMQGRYQLDPSALPTWSGPAALRAHISAAVVDLADITGLHVRFGVWHEQGVSCLGWSGGHGRKRP